MNPNKLENSKTTQGPLKIDVWKSLKTYARKCRKAYYHMLSL